MFGIKILEYTKRSSLEGVSIFKEMIFIHCDCVIQCSVTGVYRSHVKSLPFSSTIIICDLNIVYCQLYKVLKICLSLSPACP